MESPALTAPPQSRCPHPPASTALLFLSWALSSGHWSLSQGWVSFSPPPHRLGEACNSCSILVCKIGLLRSTFQCGLGHPMIINIKLLSIVNGIVNAHTLLLLLLFIFILNRNTYPVASSSCFLSLEPQTPLLRLPQSLFVHFSPHWPSMGHLRI